jgi:enoyl-CoA hydratase/carnithine racemase
MFVEQVVTGNVAELVLAAPDVRNSLGPEEARELRLAIEAISATPAVHVAVLTHHGSSFCAGGNLRKILDLVAGGRKMVTDVIYAEFQGLFRAIEAMRQPLICAVDGPAIGLGCDLALAADLTFFGKDAFIAQGWAALGLVPAPGGTRSIVRKGGREALWRLIAEGRINAAQAEANNLGVAVENALKAARATAQRIAALPAGAIAATRHLSQIDDFEEHLAIALSYQSDFLTDSSFASKAEKLLSRRE